jgi:hypothetical protein
MAYLPLSLEFTTRRKLAGLDGGAGANVELDLHGHTPFFFSLGFTTQRKLAGLGGSANVDLDLHGLPPCSLGFTAQRKLAGLDGGASANVELDLHGLTSPLLRFVFLMTLWCYMVAGAHLR